MPATTSALLIHSRTRASGWSSRGVSGSIPATSGLARSSREQKPWIVDTHAPSAPTTPVTPDPAAGTGVPSGRAGRRSRQPLKSRLEERFRRRYDQ